MREEMEVLFHDQWGMLNKLCNLYFDKINGGLSSKAISEQIEREISKFTDSKNLQSIEDSVNRYMDNIVDTMNSEFSFLGKNNISFLTFIMAGFSVRAVCLMTGLQTKNYYTRKRRLIERIKASNVPGKDKILSRIV